MVLQASIGKTVHGLVGHIVVHLFYLDKAWGGLLTPCAPVQLPPLGNPWIESNALVLERSVILAIDAGLCQGQRPSRLT